MINNDVNFVAADASVPTGPRGTDSCKTTHVLSTFNSLTWKITVIHTHTAPPLKALSQGQV